MDIYTIENKYGSLIIDSGKKQPLRRFVTETHNDFSLEISGN